MIICMPTSEGPPKTWSTIQNCDKCGTEVWLSQNYVGKDRDLFRCVPCAVPDIRLPESIVEAAPWTTEDFKKRLALLLKRIK